MTAHRFMLPLLFALTSTAVAQSPPQASKINIPFDSYRLPNGMTVILSPDHSTPTVAVSLWYHVGSKNETPGRTGFAHLFEHLMFMGSLHAPYGMHDKLTNEVGGNNNATTANDRTNYFETTPSNYLESSLWLESDRMGFLLDTMTLDKLNAQRDVVKNERRQSVDNQPYGRVGEIFSEHMYPKGHPYSWDVIGSMADLSAASVEDVQNFFKLYYAPNNAAIAVVGDFDEGQAKGWVERYFGPFQEGKPVTRPVVPLGKLEKPQRLVFEDRVQVPRLYIQWPTVGTKNDDHYALSVLGPVLSGARTARLTKALVYDQQIAANVSARQGTNEDVGEFEITVTPRPGHTLEELETAVDAVVQKFLAEGPTQDEVQKVLAPAELSFLSGLQSNLGKANTLLEGATYFNDPAHFKVDFEKRTHVTAPDVLHVAKKYLTPNRIVMSCVPLGKPELASKAAESTKVGGTTGGAQ